MLPKWEDAASANSRPSASCRDLQGLTEYINQVPHYGGTALDAEKLEAEPDGGSGRSKRGKSVQLRLTADML
jgi:hypothetical protein